ncbi:LINE-1 retrotransposable element ORF1 protein [Holothuria leucospilota]|uniref:LINE-1 retrotransposable element ORF1 protein n=1 Tax=Holothuria leucospilota TaxID=206669 RepID=A0A9Q1HB86_HOLLE|nr:LINE-1 retrotransposable element ORF1 protein [Holothuria leucospilota]
MNPPKPKRRGRPPLSSQSTLSHSRSEARGLLRYTMEDPENTDDQSDTDVEGDWKSAIEGFQQVVERSLRNLQTSISKLERELGKAVEFQAKRIDDLESKMAAKEKELEDFSQKIAALERALDYTTDDVNKQERMSRRNNFRIVGIPSTEDEDCESIVKTRVLPLFPEIQDVRIERCHRDGRSHGDRSPHILVKCLSYKDKVAIMKARRSALENKPFFIVDDLTRIDLKEKKKWADKVTELYNQGTKLRFFGGKWRDASGKPYQF